MERTIYNSLLGLRPCAFYIVVFIIFSLLKWGICDLMKSSNFSDVQLINEAAKWFPSQDSSKGYEGLLRRYNKSEHATIFFSEDMGDNQIRHNESDDTGVKLLILPGETETLRAPYKDVTTYLVLRQRESKPDRYTSHLAYVRKFPNETSLEWDLYTFHFHNPNGSFISAFFPVRGGPDLINFGVGLQEGRQKRWLSTCGVSVFGYVSVGFGCKPQPDKKTQADIDRQVANQAVLYAQQQRSQLSQGPRTSPPKLQWSWITTELTTRRTTTPKSLIDEVTEFPMYGESGTGDELDENGFTTHPPWSEFRRYEETTEMPDPFANAAPSGPKKICFGLARNCIERASEKPPPRRSCPFGLNCRDKTFVDRFAVATTTGPPNVKVVEKNKKTKEECEAEEAARSKRYALSDGSETPWNRRGRNTEQQGRAAQYLININNIVCKGGKKCDIGGGGSGGKGKDPCAKYKKRKSTTASPAGAESMGIQEGSTPTPEEDYPDEEDEEGDSSSKSPDKDDDESTRTYANNGGSKPPSSLVSLANKPYRGKPSKTVKGNGQKVKRADLLSSSGTPLGSDASGEPSQTVSNVSGITGRTRESRNTEPRRRMRKKGNSIT